MSTKQKINSQTAVSQKSNHIFNNTMIFVLYFIQYLFFGFFRSIPLTYSTVPNYQILGLFAAAPLPYSSKFLMAPFQERFYFKQYGKRKTWIVINLLFMAFFAYILSTIVGLEDYQLSAAIILICCFVASALKDVSTDALAVEIIESSGTVSTINFFAHQIGKATSLSVFLALISKEYWSRYGLEDSIITASTFIKIVVVFILTATLIVHLFFDQSKYRKVQQVEQNKESIWDIIKHYRHFFHFKYQLCRFCILLLIINHGLAFFITTNKIVEKQALMLVGDLCAIPTVIICYFLGKIVNNKNVYRFYNLTHIFRFALCLFLYFVEIRQPAIIFILSATIKVLVSVAYYLVTCMVVQKARGQLSSLNIAIFFSCWGIGNNSAPQNEIIYILGYDNSMYLGFALTLITTIFLPIIYDWIETGQKIGEDKEKQQ